MTRATRILSAVLAGLAGSLGAQSPAAKPTIVLVHGAFADGSSWSKVIPILQRDGYTVIAVQNPLTSLAADVETTKRVVDAQKGPVVLVGHSYGGAGVTHGAPRSSNREGPLYRAAVSPAGGAPHRKFCGAH